MNKPTVSRRILNGEFKRHGMASNYNKVEAAFKEAVFEETGLSDHPKKHELFGWAYEVVRDRYNHDEGGTNDEEVLCFLQEFSNIISK